MDIKEREVLLKINCSGETPVDSSPTKFVLPGCKLANKSEQRVVSSGVELHPLANTGFNISK